MAGTSPDQQAAAAAANDSLPGTTTLLGSPALGTSQQTPFAGTPLGATPFAARAAAAATAARTPPGAIPFIPFAARFDQGLPATAVSQQAAAQASQNAVPGQSRAVSQSLIQGTLPTPTSFVGQIPFFLNAILSTPAGALPKGPLWVIVFDFDTFILNTIKSVKQYEPRMPEPWLIDQALNTVTSYRYQTEKGCMFAQAVTIPGESLIYAREGIQYNSFIRGGVGQGRQDFNSVQINFLNTNVNFVDNVIRPWVVMTGHLGMIARPESKKYRCNLTIYKLGIDRVDRPPFIAQQFNFWEVCPINVSSEDLNYTSDGSSIVKTAEFVYQWYTTTSYKNTFATAGIEASPVDGPDVRRGIPVSTAMATAAETSIPVPQTPKPTISPGFR